MYKAFILVAVKWYNKAKTGQTRKQRFILYQHQRQ